MIARELGKRLKRQVIAIDDLIEARENLSIHDIFKAKGEVYFRDIEHKAVKEASCRENVVIDCGGGVVLRKENLQALKSNGIVFYLEATPEVIYQRIKGETHRPLLKTSDPLGCIKELFHQRLPLYNQADHTIDANDASIEGPVAEILKRIEK